MLLELYAVGFQKKVLLVFVLLAVKSLILNKDRSIRLLMKVYFSDFFHIR